MINFISAIAMGMMSYYDTSPCIYKKTVSLLHTGTRQPIPLMPAVHHNDNIIRILPGFLNLIIIIYRIQWIRTSVRFRGNGKFILTNIDKCKCFILNFLIKNLGSILQTHASANSIHSQ